MFNCPGIYLICHTQFFPLRGFPFTSWFQRYSRKWINYKSLQRQQSPSNYVFSPSVLVIVNVSISYSLLCLCPLRRCHFTSCPKDTVESEWTKSSFHQISPLLLVFSIIYYADGNCYQGEKKKKFYHKAQPSKKTWWQMCWFPPTPSNTNNKSGIYPHTLRSQTT